MLIRRHSFLDARVFEKEARSLKAMGHHVTVMGPKHKGRLLSISRKPISIRKNSFKRDGVHVVTYRANRITGKKRVAFMQRRMIQNMKRRVQTYFVDHLWIKALRVKADVYHAHEWETLYEAVQIKRMLRKRKRRVKVVFDAHELEQNTPLLKLLMREVDHIITVSDSLKRIYAKRYPKIPITVIYNSPAMDKVQIANTDDTAEIEDSGNIYDSTKTIDTIAEANIIDKPDTIDTEDIIDTIDSSDKNDTDSRSDKAPIPIGTAPTVKKVPAKGSLPFMITYEGMLTKDKGDPYKVIQIVNRCAKSGMNVKFKILGKVVAANKREQMNIVKKIRSNRRISCTWVDFKDLPKHLANTHVGYIYFHLNDPNRIYALPNKFFSYLNSGIPVVVNNAADMRSFINKHKCGIVINKKNPTAADYASQFIRLNANRNLLDKLSQNARNVMQTTYCWERMEQRLERIYRSLRK